MGILSKSGQLIRRETINGIEYKECTTCNEMKSTLTEFYTTGKHGRLGSKCKKCKNRQKIEWASRNEINKEKTKLANAKYYDNEEVKLKRKIYMDKWAQENKDHLKEYDKKRKQEIKERRKIDPEFDEQCRRENRDRSWNYTLKNKYKITPEQYEQMVVDCNNKCRVCGTDGTETFMGKLFIDHCHETGVVRGLLCNACNIALGAIKDRPDIANKLIKYLYDTNSNK